MWKTEINGKARVLDLKNLSLCEIKKLDDIVMPISAVEELKQNNLVTSVRWITAIPNVTIEEYGHTVYTDTVLFAVQSESENLAVVKVKNLAVVKAKEGKPIGRQR